MTKRAPVSLNQRDQLRTIRRYPEIATTYDASYVTELRGADVSALQYSLAALLSRHDALRSHLEVDSAGAHWQVVVDEVAPVVPELVYSSWAEFAALLGEQRLSLTHIDAGAPLCRIRLVVVEDRLHLIISVHHLAYDGWSLGLIWRDLAELYRAAVSNGQAALPEPRSYLDYSAAQHDEWRGGLARSALSRWSGRLAGYAPPDWEELTPALTWEIEATELEFGSDTIDRVRAFARRCGVAPFTILAVASGMATARVRGMETILIGSDFSNRDSRANREVVGHVVTTRPVLLQNVDRGSLESVLIRARDDLARDRDLAGVCFEEVHEALGNAEMLKVNLYESNGLESAELDLPGVEASSRWVANQRRHWRALGFFWELGPGVMETSIRWRKDLVRPETISQVVDLLNGELLGSLR